MSDKQLHGKALYIKRSEAQTRVVRKNFRVEFFKFLKHAKRKTPKIGQKWTPNAIAAQSWLRHIPVNLPILSQTLGSLLDGLTRDWDIWEGCGFLNGTVNSAGGCYNSTTNTQSYCCCYADSCNWAIRGEKELNKILISGILAVFVLLF
ncbi:unnamed protein product [Meloidogyne enterolobii]|uniref:Uncharacterized protein n=1 Tax=Meloidogyne enterolobii TaxID=390850 RepID=A0ACB0ZZG9_MELEN